jgi:hypothetical protein
VRREKPGFLKNSEVAAAMVQSSSCVIAWASYRAWQCGMSSEGTSK